MYQENKNLLDEINERRSKLLDSAQKNGLRDEETVKRSQELDQLIFQYQKLIHKSPKRQEGKKLVLRTMMMLLPSVLVEV
ncbi:MAG: Spo0E-like regulatory phosphatase [Bacillus sp. (in: firmicutes)]|uniref:aspartyl-phosphate phosphatase Spo0E family protein n=1 Tax=Bacillus sp. 1NLA3E TaxID=666686 RepID=UPI000247F1FF|nr:aspartyl-phosphate phosphatase Spo0E family protein [Bacillus sp. 1NLA3E]AGK52825.1 Spo0E-like regulatory phosphatase [Bacillus sp. 1NLA3E]MDF2903846.1 Spo0E-like regulatory phosphatase [Bacillus sp. (in: firmicutes)]